MTEPEEPVPSTHASIGATASSSSAPAAAAAAIIALGDAHNAPTPAAVPTTTWTAAALSPESVASGGGGPAPSECSTVRPVSRQSSILKRRLSSSGIGGATRHIHKHVSPAPYRRAGSTVESRADGRKNGRVIRSCENCRTRKMKCSQTRPACTNCELRGDLCVYAEAPPPETGTITYQVETLKTYMAEIKRLSHVNERCFAWLDDREARLARYEGRMPESFEFLRSGDTNPLRRSSESAFSPSPQQQHQHQHLGTSQGFVAYPHNLQPFPSGPFSTMMVPAPVTTAAQLNHGIPMMAPPPWAFPQGNDGLNLSNMMAAFPRATLPSPGPQQQQQQQTTTSQEQVVVQELVRMGIANQTISPQDIPVESPATPSKLWQTS